MRIVFTYNERTADDDEAQAERFGPDYINRLKEALLNNGHEVVPVEASGPPDMVIEEILDARPDLVFNMAEGTDGEYREAMFPTLFEFLNIPYTGGGPELMAIGLDKRLTEELLELRGVRVPKGCIMRSPDDPMRADMEPPFMVKPNYEGSSMGIHQDSIVDTRDAAREKVGELIKDFPEGIEVEEYIEGKEVTVPFLAAHEPPFLEPVEYEFLGTKHNIFDYETKSAKNVEDRVKTHIPARLTDDERDAVMALAAKAFSVLRTPDFGRADMRLRSDGTPFLIEVNPMPGLRPVSPVIRSAEAMGIAYDDVVRMVIESASRRHGLTGPVTDEGGRRTYQETVEEAA